MKSPEPPGDPASLTGVADLEPVEASRHPVPLDRREGVFVHVYRCRVCQVKWAVFSWLADPTELRVGSITCPWCHRTTAAVHERATVSDSRVFLLDDPGREIVGLVRGLALESQLLPDSRVGPLEAYAGDIADRD
jgi:hypothetical protein